MISNLSNDVIHDLLRDLRMNFSMDLIKRIIETWEGNREKYLGLQINIDPDDSSYMLPEERRRYEP